MEKLEVAISEMLPHLDERQKRLYLGSEAKKLGFGGVSLISKLSKVSRPTIIEGKKELEQMGSERVLGLVKTRKQGGGRKKSQSKDSTLLKSLENLVEPVSRGDPESPLRWTCKSLRNCHEIIYTYKNK